MSNSFVTSDPHLNHINIIRYSNRPWLRPGDLTEDGFWVSRKVAIERTHEMDEGIIANWNNKVKPEDDVTVIGDFCFGRAHDAVRYIKRLNGYILFVYGNHDRGLKELQNSFYNDIDLYHEVSHKIQFLPDLATVKLGPEAQEVVLCHYALRVWNKSHHGVWHLYGHSHGSLPDDPESLSFDVGMDVHNFTPLSFDEVKAIMAKKTYKPKDHHGRRRNERTTGNLGA